VLVRRLARPMLSSIFVTSGFNALRNPDPMAPAAVPVIDKLRAVLPESAKGLVPKDPAMAVRVNGGIHLVGGLMLATGRFPRVASAALAATLVPTTLTGHPFWKEQDPAKRVQQQVHFFKNLSLFGGLLIAAVDTEGKPSVAWRSRAAAHRAGDAVASALPSGSDSSDAVSSLKATFGHVAEAAKEHGAHLADVVKEQAPVVAEAAKEHGAHLAGMAKEQGAQIADVVKEQAPVVAEAAKAHGAAVAEATREQAPVVADIAKERGGEFGRRAAEKASQASLKAAKAAQQARSQLA